MASSEIFFLMVIWKEHYNFKCRTLLCFIIFYIVYSIFQSEFFRKKMINNVIYFKIQKNRIVLQTTKMGLKILLLLNEKPLNFTILKNTKLEGAISGPNWAPILQAQIWARSGRAFHYWSGARQITLSGPHFSRSGPDRRPTKISARDTVQHLFIQIRWKLQIFCKNKENTQNVK